MKENKKTVVVIIILTILLAAAVVICFFMWRGKVKAEKSAEEYRIYSESLEKQINEAKETEDALKKKAEKYQEDYNALVGDMLSDAVLAEHMGNLITNVWNNAIIQVSNSETDKFTKPNGTFVTDFNDALKNLWNDEEFSEKASELFESQSNIKDRMKDMLNVPEGFENAFRALEEAYNSYITLTNIVLRCDGSLNSFSEDFLTADENFGELYNAADLYVK